MPLQARFDDEIRKLFSRGARLLAAVSGGADSICLAELLDACGDIEFSLVHCNFHLRGEESDADEAYVREWAENHGKRLFVEHFDTEKYAVENGVSIEMAARELRYRRFGEICTEHHLDAVVTAHNANDNAETLVLNLLRGTGIRGLAGMEAKSPLPCCDGDIVLVRPLLAFTRVDIERFLTIRHVSWRNDSTNTDIGYKRNRIRNRIFPEFEAINPSFLQTLNEDMCRFAQARDILDSWYESIKDGFYVTSDTGAEVDLMTLSSHENWQYLLFRCLERYGFSQDSCDRIHAMVVNGVIRSGRVFHSPAYDGVIDGTSLVISKRVSEDHGAVEIADVGQYRVGTMTVCINHETGMPERLSIEDGVICDAGKLPFPFTVRTWNEGDWMSPLGMKGRRKKLSDMLKDDGIGISRRSSTVCIASGSHVYAIPAIGRIDEAIKIDGNTARILKITIKE